MRVVLYPALWFVTFLIVFFETIGICLEWTASRLVPMQKFLSRKIGGQS